MCQAIGGVKDVVGLIGLLVLAFAMGIAGCNIEVPCLNGGKSNLSILMGRRGQIMKKVGGKPGVLVDITMMDGCALPKDGVDYLALVGFLCQLGCRDLEQHFPRFYLVPLGNEPSLNPPMFL